MIYLDYNATCPLAEEVQVAITDALKIWANPSSNSERGKYAKECIESARESLAKLLDCQSSEIIFTSGGTEANNLTITSSMEYFRKICDDWPYKTMKNAKPHIISSQIEHDSVKLCLEHLRDKDLIDLTLVSVDPTTGYIVVDEIFANIRPFTCLISIMLANNETGVIQPFKQIAERLATLNKQRDLRILLHTDAAQAIGKIPVSVQDLSVDYLTVVGHKFYGPRIGALFAKLDPDTQRPLLFPNLIGGGQERGYRPGTENTPMIVGLGEAARLAYKNLKKYKSHMRTVRDYFERILIEKLGKDSVVCHFQESNRLPNTSSLSFPKLWLTGSKLLSARKTFTASTGAACHSGVNASAVLLSCGVDLHLAERTVRFSCGRETTEADMALVTEELKETLRWDQAALHVTRGDWAAYM